MAIQSFMQQDLSGRVPPLVTVPTRCVWTADDCTRQLESRCRDWEIKHPGKAGMADFYSWNQSILYQKDYGERIHSICSICTCINTLCNVHYVILLYNLQIM